MGKKIVATLAISAGAGVALMVANRSTKRAKGRSYPVQLQPPMRPDAVCCSRPALSARWADRDFPPQPIPSGAMTTVEPAILLDEAAGPVNHEWVARLMDSAIILLACGLFFGIFQAFSERVRIDLFDAAIFLCSAILIAVLYRLVFSIGDQNRTAGQVVTELSVIAFGGGREMTAV